MDDGRRTMNDVTEAIARVLAGDVNAYAIIYSACNEALRAFVVRRHGYLGDDFINEVVIRTHEQALRNLNRYSSDKGASFQTWLNWQARSTAWRVEREWYSRRFVRFNPAVHAIQAVSAAGPVDLYEEKRLWQVLREETESLPEERRSILSHDFEARSHAENARSTGLTYEQVRYRRRLVLRRLRDRLCARGVRPVPVDSTPVPHLAWRGRRGATAQLASRGPYTARRRFYVVGYRGSPGRAGRAGRRGREGSRGLVKGVGSSQAAGLPEYKLVKG